MSSSKKELKSKIDILRDNLIDLSDDNKFLNFNFDADDSLPIIDIDFYDIFSKLVLNNDELELTFEKSEKELIDLLNDDNLTDRAKIVFKKNKKRLEEFENEKNKMEYYSQNTISILEIPNYYIDRTNELVLNTPFQKMKFDRILQHIDSGFEKELALEGISELYLALGFLEYDNLIAPLMFIPILLENRENKWYIRFSNHSEIKVNQYLKIKFEEIDFDLPLNYLKTGMDMLNYFTNIVNITPEEYELKPYVALSLFNFENINLYEDLNIGNLSEFNKNELNYHLSDKDYEGFESKVNERDLDSIPKELKYNIYNVDSSQESIIEEATLGGNILVDTHSATNKSDTIINLISNILAIKKTVLYVSNKIEAINEIKSKLDEIGFKFAYLDLYGVNYNSSQLVDEIIHTADYNFEDLNYNPKYFNLKIEDANNLNNKINSYLDFLHSPFKKLNISPYELLGLRERSLARIKKSKSELKALKMHNITSFRHYTTKHSY